MKKFLLTVGCISGFFLQFISAQCKVDSIIYYNVEPVTSERIPVNYSKRIYSKDTFSGMLSYQWNSTAKQWEVYNKQSPEYDSKGRMIRLYSRSWSGSQWDELFRQDKGYDASGNETLNVLYSWNALSKVYENYNKTVTDYDLNDHKIQSTVAYWDKTGNTWVNASKDEFVYSGNILFSQISSLWNTDSVQWLKALKIVNEIDGSNHIYKQHVFRWNCDGTGCHWDTNSYADYYMDKDKNDTAVYYYDIAGNELYAVLRSTYDANGCLLTEKNYTKDPGMPLAWTDETVYTYLDNSSGLNVADLPAFSVYPNPSCNFIEVSNALSPHFIMMDALSGQSLLSGELSGGNAGRIDVSGLSNGLYLLKVGSCYKKIIINH